MYRDDEIKGVYTSCMLPSLPERRFHGTLNELKYCCGGEWRVENNPAWTSCIELRQSSWVTSNVNLPPRWSHRSWATEKGIYLMGGESNNGNWTLDQSKTTTLVKSDGSSSPGGFTMHHIHLV